jgi:hypothetical protein
MATAFRRGNAVRAVDPGEADDGTRTRYLQLGKPLAGCVAFLAALSCAEFAAEASEATGSGHVSGHAGAICAAMNADPFAAASVFGT